MRINSVYIRYTCTECAHEYTESVNYTMYNIDYIYYHVKRNKIMCKKCFKLAVISSAIKTTIADSLVFDIIEDKIESSLEWSCGVCDYSWLTHESFKDNDTKKLQLAFIHADKQCPICSSMLVNLKQETQIEVN